MPKLGLPFLLILLSITNAGVYRFYPAGRFDSIVIHHSATDVGDYETIRRAHRARGWDDAAYHLVLSNGSTGIPAGYLEATDRYRTLEYSVATRDRESNLRGVHLCVVGNFEKHEFPDSLKAPVVNAIQLLQDIYCIRDAGILFHGSDCNATKCPGACFRKENFLRWLYSEGGSCADDVSEQQEEVITGTTMPGSSRTAMAGMMGGVSTGIILVWVSGAAAAARLKKRRNRRGRNHS